MGSTGVPPVVFSGSPNATPRFATAACFITIAHNRGTFMITGTIRSQIDAIWDAFWSGGISNPLEIIEQITYLLFLKRLDDLHTLEHMMTHALKVAGFEWAGKRGGTRRLSQLSGLPISQW